MKYGVVSRYSQSLVRFLRNVRRVGWRNACGHIREVAGLRLLRSDLDGLVARRRIELSAELCQRFDNTVQAGNFRGMRLPDQVWWGRGDRACILMGMYESEVQHILFAACRERSHFVDIGAADGFYAVGMLVSRAVSRVTAFEMSAQGRGTIRMAAQINGVEDRIQIEGTADATFFNKLGAHDARQMIVLIDIEGAEFDLLDDTTVEQLAGAVMIIELHYEHRTDGHTLIEKLVERTRPYFTHTFFSTGPRNPNVPELQRLSDDCRWLACSESRPQQMCWLLLEPHDSTLKLGDVAKTTVFDPFGRLGV